MIRHGPRPAPGGATSTSTQTYLDALRPILEAAGDVALEHFRTAQRERKHDGTAVTLADRAAEEVLVDGLARAFPNDAVISEEGTEVSGGGGTWHVDPIDGTGAFLDQLAHWGPTVCLVRDGELVAGALWIPRLRELWYAERGKGAWRDGVPLSPDWPSEVRHFDKLYLPSRFHRRPGPLPWPGKVRALGASAVHLAQVACGGGMAAVIPRWKLWDIGCGILLVEEVGGVLRTLQSEPFDPLRQPGVPFVAGAPAALNLLAQQD